ncbi:MAG: 16S rRNA (cytidine(1402)-2'-O)-methyltransferase [Chlamydiae bacterium]|nr:16S rRNA (cytidine(1402)-2'-O)-methyltransferase [Chlamydiota bacterium]
MLYLIATPIGNLADITIRALTILQLCDYILCEDTKHSRILLAHHKIQKPLKSYHKFNESEKEKMILEDLREGKNIALISDAGTPGICDPGQDLIQACRLHDLPYTVIPGPCAAIVALTLSGLSTEKFQMIGFLPKKLSDLQKIFQEILYYPGTSISYETPHRIEKTLELAAKHIPTCKLCIVREITKKFEEILHGTAEELLDRIKQKPLKGEIVLLFSPSNQSHAQLSLEELTPEEHVKKLQEEFGLSLQEAIKTVAKHRQVPKREIYNKIHREES